MKKSKTVTIKDFGSALIKIGKAIEEVSDDIGEDVCLEELINDFDFVDDNNEIIGKLANAMFKGAMIGGATSLVEEVNK